MTTTHAAPSTDRASTGPVGRTRLVAAALAATSLTVAALVLLQPWGDRFDSSSEAVLAYEAVQPQRDVAWPTLLLDAFAFGLLGICVALAACHLVRERGRVVATAGGVLLVLGGLLFAMGGAAFASLAWFGTGLPEDQARGFLDFVNDRSGRLVGLQAAGFLVTTVGTLAVAAALAQARAVPRPAVLLLVVLTAALFTGLPGQAMNAVQALQVLLTGALAVPLLRSTSPRR